MFCVPLATFVNLKGVKALFNAVILLSTLSAKLPATLLFNCLASSAYPSLVVTRLFAIFDLSNLEFNISSTLCKVPVLVHACAPLSVYLVII